MKSSQWLWKESCVSTGVKRSGNTCVTDRHDMTLAVNVALNLNIINQLIYSFIGNLFGRSFICISKKNRIVFLDFKNDNGNEQN